MTYPWESETPDPSTFKGPARWATWSRWRTPQFKPHHTIGQVKNALSGQSLREGQRQATLNGKKIHESPMKAGWVYEWVVDDLGEGWVERFHVKEGDYKSDHPLWQFSETPRAIRPVSQKALDATIASIMNATEEAP